MNLDALVEARQRVKDAEKIMRDNAESVIDQACKAILNNPGVDVISWGQKSSEYNDEGMYPGVNGPVINDPIFDDDDPRQRWNKEWLYGYGGVPNDPRTKILAMALEAIGEDILSDIFGDECGVDARLVGDKVVYDSEYVGC